MALPLELLQDVFPGFTKPELKGLRLVCKSFEKAASHLLFDHVVISNNYASLRTAKAVIGSFSSSIKTIVFCPIHYPQDLIEVQHYQREITRRLRRRSINHNFNQHLGIAHATCCRLALEQQEINENGECLAALSIALRVSTNARTLSFAALSEPGNMRQEWDMARYDVSRSDLCTSIGCTMTTEDHLDFFVTPDDCYGRPMHEMWYPAMIALSASDSRISEVDMQCSDGYGWDSCLSITAFDSTLHQVRYVQRCLETLTKLHLEVGLLHTDPSEKSCYDRGDVAKALSTACNLESLWLYACQPNIDGSGEDLFENSFQGSIFAAFDSFLGHCQFPRLQSLILQSFESSESDLLAFLQGSPHLENLTLSGYSLTAGSWESAVEQIRRILSLKRITLHYLHGFGLQNPWGQHFTWHTSRVDEFFFANGNNPFTWEAMAQYSIDQTRYHRDYECDAYFYPLEWHARFRELERQYYGTLYPWEELAG